MFCRRSRGDNIKSTPVGVLLVQDTQGAQTVTPARVLGFCCRIWSRKGVIHLVQAQHNQPSKDAWCGSRRVLRVHLQFSEAMLLTIGDHND